MSVVPVLYGTCFTKVKLSSVGGSQYGYLVASYTLLTMSESPHDTTRGISLVTFNTALTIARVLPLTPVYVGSDTMPSSPSDAAVQSPATLVGYSPQTARPITSFVTAVLSVSTGHSAMFYTVSAAMHPNAL